MPVILEERDENKWLDPDNKDFELLQKLLKPYPSDLMKSHPVNKAVNSPRNDSPELIEEIKTKQLSL